LSLARNNYSQRGREIAKAVELQGANTTNILGCETPQLPQLELNATFAPAKSSIAASAKARESNTDAPAPSYATQTNPSSPQQTAEMSSAVDL
jgi:hypothetical protein